jgi:hypothetical protein
MTALLNSSELTWMRAVVDGVLPDTCNILSESLAPDGEGGVTSTWGTVYTDRPCRLDSAVRTADEVSIVGGGRKAVHQYMLSLADDTTINAGNRVEISTSTYTVVSVNDNQSWMAVGRAVLELI